MHWGRSARYEGEQARVVLLQVAPDLDHVDRSPDSPLCPELLRYPVYYSMSALPKATCPLPLSSTLHDLALLRALSEFDFTSILPPQPSLSATTDSAVTDASSRLSLDSNDKHATAVAQKFTESSHGAEAAPHGRVRTRRRKTLQSTEQSSHLLYAALSPALGDWQVVH